MPVSGPAGPNRDEAPGDAAPTFEAALHRLEDIVQRLERG